MKRLEPGWYEDTTYIVAKIERTEQRTVAGVKRDYNSTRRVSYWSVKNKSTGALAQGFGSKKDCMLAISEGRI